MSYDILEHTHRFAIWTAARAVQRSFTKTENIFTGIESTTLRIFSEAEKDISLADYDLQHKEWSEKIIESFKKQRIECSYGRAAKIIAIYLKTAVIIPERGLTKRCAVIHPPIDRILLHALAKHQGLKHLSKKVWTQFDASEYFEVAERIREKLTYFNWRIEVDWNLKNDDEHSIDEHLSPPEAERNQILFDGYCPESLVKGKKVEMRLNSDDFWESVATGLQITIFPPFATILKWRGKGSFRESSDEASNIHTGLIYAEASSLSGHEIFPDQNKPMLYHGVLVNYLNSIFADKKSYDLQN